MRRLVAVVCFALSLALPTAAQEAIWVSITSPTDGDYAIGEVEITVEVVARADVAEVEFGFAERETFARQLDQILQYVESIQSLDTADVPPMSHALATGGFRPDVPGKSLEPERALDEAGVDMPFPTQSINLRLEPETANQLLQALPQALTEHSSL